MENLIAPLSHGVPVALSEAITLGKTLKKRADDVLGLRPTSTALAR